MKKQIVLFIVGIASLAMLNSCNKDNVTQEDVITNQQLIDLVIRVMDASDPTNALDSAVVEIVDGKEVKSAVTDESGLVFFEGVQISDYTPVTITKTGYAPIYSESYTTPNDYRQIQVTKTYQLFPLSGDNMVTITGQLTIETDVTNRERETVGAGLKVKAYNFSMTTDMAFYAETDANGEYTLQVPVRVTGNDDIEIQYPEIYTNQTVAIENEDNFTIAVEERPVFYTLATNSKSNAIPGVPSAYAVIDAPALTTIGSGLDIQVKTNRVPLTWYSNAILIDGGSGYSDGNDQLIDLSSDPSGNAAQIQVDVVDGSIVNIDGFINNGAEYAAAPTINTSVLGGSGAEIEIQYEGQCEVYIANNGSGYVDFPDVFIEYHYYNGTVLTEYEYKLNISSYTDLSAGKIVNDNFNDVDTIMTIGGVASIPVITIIDVPTEQMYISFDAGDINNMGQITSYNTEEYGYGYNPADPPSISIMPVAGYGSGAILNIDLNTSGELSNIDYVNRGTGFVDNVNDFRDNGTTGNSYENPSFSYSSYYDGFRNIYNIDPGATYIRSAHYGTGTPVEDF